jgi:zinc transport system substrate-binding protein
MIRTPFVALLLSASTAAAEVPLIVADIPPIHSLVASVMGDLGQPALLLGQGADSHDYQMRPSDARALAGADAVFWIGPEMTPWLGRALAGIDPNRVVGLLDAPDTHTRLFVEEEEGAHDHAAEEKDHDNALETGEGHHHDGIDPHAFLDPSNATLWLTFIADRLSQLDPANAATYRANAEAEAARIAALDADLAARLGPVSDRPIVVFHEAFGYFADHYKLTVRGSVAPSDAADPGAARLSAIRAALADVVCIFPEAGHDPKQIALLAEGTPARIGDALDPEGRNLEPGPTLYTTLLSNLGASIAACLTDG